MKGYRRILVEGGHLLCIGGLLFAFPEESLEAAREGITLCLDVLIPLSSLFVLSSPAHRNRGGWVLCPSPVPVDVSPVWRGGRWGGCLGAGLIEGIQLELGPLPSWWSAGNAAGRRHAASPGSATTAAQLFSWGPLEWGSLALRRWGSFCWEPIWGRQFCWEFFCQMGNPSFDGTTAHGHSVSCRCLPSLPNFQDVHSAFSATPGCLLLCDFVFRPHGVG